MPKSRMRPMWLLHNIPIVTNTVCATFGAGETTLVLGAGPTAWGTCLPQEHSPPRGIDDHVHQAPKFTKPIEGVQSNSSQLLQQATSLLLTARRRLPLFFHRGGTPSSLLLRSSGFNHAALPVARGGGVAAALFLPAGAIVDRDATRHAGRTGETLDLDTTLLVLCDVWAMCLIRGSLNLSYDCMTSFETNERLIHLCTENPGLWNDLQTKSTRDYRPGDHDEVVEDLELYDDEEMGEDDSEIPAREVVHHIATKKTAINPVEIVGEPKMEGSGKRTCRANAKYADFWRHANNKDEDLEVPGL
ncbi:hypothetical protein DFH08DRAFT_1015038 [Mycena albidolilacea]|uniref:Uncharacterized protein n=1 Tax=Mycena albidolilacea TaxID=1033008 RepID=A0AAD6ZTF5_9AGAR|nr:hypothetical protein DFH08DRAFT_1015038 [Mycena albidolilacea]